MKMVAFVSHHFLHLDIIAHNDRLVSDHETGVKGPVTLTGAILLYEVLTTW